MAPRHEATPAQTYYGSPVKLEEYGDAGGVRNGAAEEDWRGDLSPGMEAIRRRPCGFGGVGWDHTGWERVRTTGFGQELGPYGFGVLPFATWLRQQ